MTPPVCLFVLSADFGEFVTANLFARGQPFVSHFALPQKLAPHVSPELDNAVIYQDLADIERCVDALRPDIVVLCSGYLFAVNGLMAPERLAAFVKSLCDSNIRVLTTDPWLGIWQAEPDTRFDIYSVRQGRIDPEISERMNALQKYLAGLFREVDHLYAVPLERSAAHSHCFFNAAFTTAAAKMPGSAGQARDDWLMVLSREDYAYLAGVAPQAFLATLDARVDEIVAHQSNRLTFVGPSALEKYFINKSSTCNRISFHGFCNFSDFEALLRRSRVVIYWNVLSSSLLYCLYYQVAPIFFGTGHQTKVCRGLLDHVVRNVYGNDAPPVLDQAAPLVTDVDRLLDQLDVMPWLHRLRDKYAQLSAPAEIVNQIRGHS